MGLGIAMTPKVSLNMLNRQILGIRKFQGHSTNASKYSTEKTSKFLAANLTARKSVHSF